MSAGQQVQPLAFLTAPSPVRGRRSRQTADALRLWLRLSTLCLLLLAGTFLPYLLSSPEVPFGWVLLASTVGVLAAFEIGRHRTALGTLAAMVLAAASAGLSGGVILVCVGVPWTSAAGWTSAESATALFLLSGEGLAYSYQLGSLMREGRLVKRVAVVGSGALAQRAVAQLEDCNPLLVQTAGWYVVREQQIGAEHRGDLRTLSCDARLDMIDAIVLAMEPAEASHLHEVEQVLRTCVQDVFALPESACSLRGSKLEKLGEVDMLVVQQQPIKGASLTSKRAFDVIVSCMLLGFMAPLLGLIALAVRLETSGPVLFRQLRVGYNNQLFYIFKFRSMYWQSSDRLAKQQTVRGDKRITRVGRIIRRLSLDELPQLLNVVSGEMSLVGPRPHAPGTSIGGQRVHTLVEDYGRRHLVRPGITGLAQVRGLRGGLEDRRQVADRISADLEYIERWSLWLDIRILLGTVLLELRDSRGS